MKPRIFLTGLIAVLALALAGAACGGDDEGDEQTSIRTQQGLAVAAVSGQLGGNQTGAQSADIGAPNTGGDATETADRSAKGADLGFAGLSYSPSLQAGQTGITVQGYGSATADPDSALIEFYFSRSGYGDEPKPVPLPGEDGTSSSGSSGSIEPATRDSDTAVAGQVEQITEADLQPVIDAIVAAGVARGDIEFMGQSYYDLYYASATLRAEVGDINSVDAVVQAAQGAAGNLGDIFLNGTSISYTVSDCAALEKAAMEAAAADANERGAAFADALGVTLGPIIGASHYSYAPYGGTACDGNFTGPYPMGGVAYAEGSAGSVQVFANVGVTYGIQ